MSAHLSGAAAVFVKTPGFSALKTRLAQSIGSACAEEFHVRSCRALEEVLKRCAHWGLQGYWAVAEAEALTHPLWSGLSSLDQGTGKLGERQSQIYQQLLQKHDYVILLGADAPQLTEQRLKEVHVKFCESKTRSRTVLGPASDGGYYLFAGNRPIPLELWNSVPYSQADTAKLLCQALIQQGFPAPELLAKEFDVDTLEDWKQLQLELSRPGVWLAAQQDLGQWMRALSIG